MIAGAPAQVARDGMLDLVLSWMRLFFKQLDRRHDQAWRAVAALHRSMLDKCLLDRMELIPFCKTLDRDDLGIMSAVALAPGSS